VRARWIEEWGGELRRGELPRPEPGPGEVLVEVEACGVGLTVLNCIRGDLARGPAREPRVPGHELVGRIVETGEGVDPGRAGERVMAFFYLFCGECRWCVSGVEPLCERFAGFLGVDRDGGYAELAAIPGRNAVRVPDGLDPVEATAVPDAIATPVHVAGRAGIGPGDRVAVIAAGGGVGIHMVQVARLFGADVAGLEAAAAKLRYLETELGVAAVDSSSFGDVELPASWGGRADVVVDLLGVEASLDWAVGALDRGGRLVVLTTFPDVSFRVSPRDLVLGQTAVLGSRYASRRELGLAAELVASDRIRAVVTQRTGLDDVERIHDELREGSLIGRGALTWGAG
jgi:D-arabinose 1-dehydrogenase-like Zn-dependent alcohol dehydrogenase